MINNTNSVFTDPHELLAYAIVDSMAADYKNALRKNNLQEIAICEDFFKSDYCKKLLILSDMNGESIMQECKKEVCKLHLNTMYGVMKK